MAIDPLCGIFRSNIISELRGWQFAERTIQTSGAKHLGVRPQMKLQYTVIYWQSTVERRLIYARFVATLLTGDPVDRLPKSRSAMGIGRETVVLDNRIAYPNNTRVQTAGFKSPRRQQSCVHLGPDCLIVVDRLIGKSDLDACFGSQWLKGPNAY
jgi:hypothetical protein